MVIINIVYQISDELDKKHFTLGIFIDLSKAFDTINHTILLDNYKFMELGVLQMIGSKVWLSCKSQPVCSN